MSKYKDFFIILATVIFTFGLVSWGILMCTESDKSRLKRNQQTLLDSIEHYKVLDSLNVVRTTALELSLKNYKKYKAKDQELIKKLKADKLSEVTTIQTTTTQNIKIELKDTFVYDSKWLNVKGVLIDDSVQLNIMHREELLIVESIRRKKFLFFKLPPKLFGFKSYEMNVISKNPNTVIDSISWVKIETK